MSYLELNVRTERLAARVKAANRANAYGHELYGLLVPIFTPFVGKKILKVDGTLLAKYKDLLLKLPYNGFDLSVFRRSSDHSLSWTIKACESYGAHTCVYHEVTVNIGDLKLDVLDKISPPFSGRTDYTVDEVLQARNVYELARRAASDAQSKLHPFGEYDN